VFKSILLVFQLAFLVDLFFKKKISVNFVEIIAHQGCLPVVYRCAQTCPCADVCRYASIARQGTEMRWERTLDGGEEIYPWFAAGSGTGQKKSSEAISDLLGTSSLHLQWILPFCSHIRANRQGCASVQERLNKDDVLGVGVVIPTAPSTSTSPTLPAVEVPPRSRSLLST